MQDEAGAIRFRVVKAGRYSDEVLEEIKATFREYLGKGLRIDVEFVDTRHESDDETSADSAPAMSTGTTR